MTNTLPFTISLDLALAGTGAPQRARYDRALKTAEAALGELLNASPPLELFTNVAREDDLAAAAAVAAPWRESASTVYVLGIGGSSLGGQALAELAVPGKGPRVAFLDNPDPATFVHALETCELGTTRFLAISKSGGTAETLAQVLIADEAIRKSGGQHPEHHFAVITEPKPSPLRAFAEAIKCPVLDHPTGIGGRYSVLSVVGMLPALLMGLDAGNFRAGARDTLANPSSSAQGAALHHALSEEGRLRETVLWPYCDRLKVFGPWWRQLWAESLGKDGKGTTPVAALGPVDQHSQLQLFLGGPGGALFTVMGAGGDAGPVVPQDGANRLGLSYLAGRTLADLVAAELRATAETLAKRGRPVRRIDIPRLDERAMGALFMHFMLETMVMGRLMGVDPFDQPAVEEGKLLARAYLEGRTG